MYEIKEYRVFKFKNKLGVKKIIKRVAKNVKTYRCIKCNLKFVILIMCYLYIREEYIRIKNFRVSKRLLNIRLNCKFCFFSILFFK